MKKLKIVVGGLELTAEGLANPVALALIAALTALGTVTLLTAI